MKNKIWVSSDHHFCHKNILKYQPDTRPYSNVEDMNHGLIEEHNKVVSPTDDVYFLGDFAFSNTIKAKSYLTQLNGNIHFIYGNHDKAMRHPDVMTKLIWAKDYHEMTVDGTRIVLCHYPIYSWNRIHHGALHMYGHTHGTIPYLHGGLGQDVGVDINECKPFNIRHLIAKMKHLPKYDPRA